MKINQNNVGSAANPAASTDKLSKSAQAAESASAEFGSTDQVQLSSLSNQLSLLSSHSSQREARLQRLIADFESGRYNPDPSQITQGILNDALSAA